MQNCLAGLKMLHLFVCLLISFTFKLSFCSPSMTSSESWGGLRSVWVWRPNCPHHHGSGECTTLQHTCGAGFNSSAKLSDGVLLGGLIYHALYCICIIFCSFEFGVRVGKLEHLFMHLKLCTRSHCTQSAMRWDLSIETLTSTLDEHPRAPNSTPHRAPQSNLVHPRAVQCWCFILILCEDSFPALTTFQ